MAKDNKNSTLKNMTWKFAERISAQMVSFVVSIILARLLDPADYGTIAIINVFIAFANVFVSDGLGSALIQKKDADDLDFSSVLFFNIGMSIILYSFLFFAAPYISAFYGNDYEVLVPTLRVMGLRLIVAAINSVQQAYVSRKMIFRKFFLATLLGTIISAVVGIVMAYNGFGVWALVAQYLTNTTIDTIVLLVSLHYYPRLKFSFERVRCLLGFGFASLGSSLLITSYVRIRDLVIGKIYSSSDLAYYNRASQFPELFMTNINASISAVIFPRLSRAQDDKPKVMELMKSFIRLSTYILTPLLVGLAAVAETLVLVLLTEKWLPCVVLLQLLCLNHIFRPMHTANLQGLRAIGRSDIVFKLEIVKKTIELISLLFVMRISVKAIVINMVVMSSVFTIVNAYPVNKLLNYPLKEQFIDVIPPLIMSSIMYGVVFVFNYLNINNYAKLCIQIIIGIIVYVGLSILTKNKEFKEVLSIAKGLISKR